MPKATAPSEVLNETLFDLDTNYAPTLFILRKLILLALKYYRTDHTAPEENLAGLATPQAAE